MQRSSLNSEIQADTFAAGLEETHQTLRNILQEAQDNHIKHAGGKEVVFEVGDQVYLSPQHFRTTRPSMKFDHKLTGPYTVTKVINNNTYKLDLQYTIRRDNVFPISLLDLYTPPTTSQTQSERQLTVIDDTVEWEVDRIFDSMRCYWKLHSLIQWAGYSSSGNTYSFTCNLP